MASSSRLTCSRTACAIWKPYEPRPIITPSQDILLGNYYITVEREGDKGEFSVIVDGKPMSKTGDAMPTVEQVLAAVRPGRGVQEPLPAPEVVVQRARRRSGLDEDVVDRETVGTALFED